MTSYPNPPSELEPQPEAVQPLGLDARSIDWVPKSERHGKVCDLGPLWFVSNINLTATATGVATLGIGARLKPVRPTVRTFYGNVLIVLAYLFTPWTAINLVDYFFVRKGNDVIGEIFKADGIYGRWGWRGNVASLVSLAAMVPFMVTSPFTGFAAAAFGNVDWSIFVCLPVAGLTWLCRDLDLETERQLVEEGILPGAH